MNQDQDLKSELRTASALSAQLQHQRNFAMDELATAASAVALLKEDLANLAVQVQHMDKLRAEYEELKFRHEQFRPKRGK